MNVKAPLSRLPQNHRQQLERYLDLLVKWNKVYNLTAIKQPEQIITHHLLDSLSIAPYLSGKRFVDVGTGAGLPGIPLAITHPDKQFVLLDSNGKKTRFCQQAVAELALNNVEVIHQRVEEYQPEEKFDAVISRAFASLADMINGCQHLLKPEGVYLAMKAKSPTDELSALPFACHADVKSLDVPGLDAERCLVVIKN